ncbi:MAG: AlpA family phage regulatory protein [Paracoccaceae bacterium]|nr:AlpA family phage regulatory protein [Paracoccaceae bacterium]
MARLLNCRTAANILGISPASFYRRVADGTIPRPVKIGSLSRWPEQEILAIVNRNPSNHI